MTFSFSPIYSFFRITQCDLGNCGSGGGSCSAIRTEAVKLDLWFQDHPSRSCCDIPLDLHSHRIIHILYPSALQTAKVAVVFQISIEPGLPTKPLNFLHQSIPMQYVQIPVDRAQAQTGNAMANNLIQLGSGRVCTTVLKLFKDDLSLQGVAPSGHSLFLLPLLAIVTINVLKPKCPNIVPGAQKKPWKRHILL
jgi:hypothetical protein